jgi:hypothetical protein
LIEWRKIDPGVLRPSNRASNFGVKSRTEGTAKTRTPVNGDDAFDGQTDGTDVPHIGHVWSHARGTPRQNRPGRSFASAGRPRGTRRMAGKARNWNAATREANSNQPPTGSPAQYAHEDSATAWVLKPEAREQSRRAPREGQSKKMHPRSARWAINGRNDNELANATDGGRTAAHRSALGIVCSLVSRTIPPALPSKPG